MQTRAVLLIVLGLVIGVLGTVFAMKALRQRDPFPQAVMAVMAHHMGALSRSVKAQRCDATDTRDHLLRLQSTATDIPTAFTGAEPHFMEAAGKLRGAIQGAVQAGPVDCAGLAAAIKPIGAACQSCHEQYR